ncbi:MAG: hypothetical protein JWP87_3473 [Labilithrix sp.]|nr:hypothetical protein [Labilithrix sp.]
MLTRFLAMAAPALLVCCSTNPPSSEALFWVQQSLATDTAPARTSAGYELITFDGNVRQRTVVPSTGECLLEDPSTRVGFTPGVNKGVATFRGGALPADGLRVMPEHVTDHPLVVETQGWQGGERLDFDETGFRGLVKHELTLTAPSSTVEIRSPAPDASKPLHVSLRDELRFEWTPTDARLLVELQTKKGDERRMVTCFFEGSDGVGVIAAGGAGMLPTADGVETTGRLSIHTHAQTSVDEGDWRVYVIASTVLMARDFVSE